MPEPMPRRLPPVDLDDRHVAEGADAPRRAPRPAMEDPLEELARILGETAGFPARPDTPAEAGRHGDGPPRGAPQQLSALEAELFDELRASVTPETRVRGDIEREVTPPIPQHPVDDHDIASLRIGSPRPEPEPPRSVEGTEAQWSDFYAYDDGVAAGSYDPAFAHDPRRPAPEIAPGQPAAARDVALSHLRTDPGYPHATFDEFGRDEIAEAAREATPLVAAEPRIMPHSREEERAAARLPHEGSGRGLKIAVAAVALVLVGGGALAAWKFGGGTTSGEPVLVRADGKPLKTVPEARPMTADTAPSLTPDDPKSASRIVSKQEDPVDQVAGRTPEGKEIRLINPGAQRPTSDVPHTVKTVVVRPDGSVVSDGAGARATPAPQAAPPAEPTAAPQNAPTMAGTPQAAPQQPAMSGEPAKSAAGTTPTVRVPAAKPAPAPAMPTAAAPTAPAAPIEPAAPPATPAIPKVKTVTVTPVTVAKPAKPAETTGPAGAPLALGPVGPKLAPTTSGPAAAPAPAPVAAPPPAAPAAAPVAITPPPAGGGSGDFMVQISASGSEAEARSSFAAAQRRHTALSGRSVDVQRADLGSKGVFYRARVSAGTREQAAALCSQIQSQGGQCMVVKR